MVNVGKYDFTDSQDPSAPNNNPDFNQDLAKTLFQMAIKDWENEFKGQLDINVTLTVGHVDFTLGGKDSDAFFGKKNPYPGKDTLEKGIAGESEPPYNWKYDKAQKSLSLTVSEIDIATDSYMYYGKAPLPPKGPFMQDALTVMRHELGHALGFSKGYSFWTSNLHDIDEKLYFTLTTKFGSRNVPMTSSSHVDFPGDLMAAGGSGRNRVDISATDVLMLVTAYNSAVALAAPEPSSVILLGTGTIALFGYARRRRQKWTMPCSLHSSVTRAALGIVLLVCIAGSSATANASMIRPQE
jgi:hypothetical protein